VWFRARPYEASVLQRQILTSDARFDGPCIIEEAGATTVVPPGWKGRMLESGHLLLSSA
jgi:N-methylhydantoinase A